jgi:hypothetical protein
MMRMKVENLNIVSKYSVFLDLDLDLDLDFEAELVANLKYLL